MHEMKIPIKIKMSDVGDAPVDEATDVDFFGSNGVITIVGDVKTAQIRKLVEASFGKLTRGEKRPIAPSTAPKKLKPSTHTLPMEKEQAVLVIGFRTVGLHDADIPVLSMLDEACSDMGSRLFNRIREELGLAYYHAWAFATTRLPVG